MVLNKVLDQVRSKNLAVHVIWTAVRSNDKRSSVDEAHKLFTKEPRATQYWDGNQDLGLTYGKIVELPHNRELAWDIYMVYAAGVEWNDVPPMPDDWQHQLGRDERQLDGDKLRKSIESLLAAPKKR